MNGVCFRSSEVYHQRLNVNRIPAPRDISSYFCNVNATGVGPVPRLRSTITFPSTRPCDLTIGMSCAVETMFPPLPPTFRETVFLFPSSPGRVGSLHRHRFSFSRSPRSRNIHLLKIIVLVFLCVRVAHFRSSRVVLLASLLQVYGFSFVLCRSQRRPWLPFLWRRPGWPKSTLQTLNLIAGSRSSLR